MGIKRVVNTDFWKDDVVAEVYSAEDRYFMLYLLTNPSAKQCGIYHLPQRTISFEMGYTQEVVRVLLDRFSNKYKNILYNPDTQEIAILNFLKHSIVKGGKPVEDCIHKELEQIKDASLITAVYQHMKPYMDKQIELSSLKPSAPASMYVGIDKVLLEFIDIDSLNNKKHINDNDNDNERIVTRIVPRIVDKPKKVKPEPKEVVYFPNDEKLNQSFLDFIQMRKSLKNGAMTERAITMMINKLSKYDNDTAISLLEKSTVNNWKDIYPEKKNDYRDVIKEWGND